MQIFMQKNLIPKQPLTFIFLFCAIASFTMLFFHEPWRDEAQACLIVQKSSSITELYHNIKYEGHPLLWFLLLYGLKFFSFHIITIKIFHWLIAMGTIYFLMYRSPLPMLWKGLIPLGYYFLFEYNILFRNYAIGILCLFIALYFIEKQRWFIAAFFISLGLYANAFIFLVSGSLWLFVFLNHIKTDPKKIIGSSFMTLISAIGAIYYTLPPLDSGFANKQVFHAQSLLDVIFKTFVLIPKFTIQFWNVNHFKYLELSISATIILIILLSYFVRFKKVFVFFLIAFSSILFFLGYKYIGHLRHQGHLYIIFIACLWLNNIYHKEHTFKYKNSYDAFFSILFVTQIYGSAIAYYFDFNYNFSQGANAAKYIKDYKLDHYFMVGDLDYAVSTVSFFAQKPIFHANARRMGTFVIWDSKRDDFPASDSLLYRISDSCASHQEVLIIKSSPFLKDSNQVVLLEKFTPDICGMESYYIYKWQNLKAK